MTKEENEKFTGLLGQAIRKTGQPMPEFAKAAFEKAGVDRALMDEVEKKALAPEIKVGDFITVGEKWLRACGFQSIIGVAFEVKNIKVYPQGTLYMIDVPGYRSWEVFDWDGVTKVDPPKAQ